MTKNIEEFLDDYFEQNGLSRGHKNVRYIQFLDTDETHDDHFENLLEGKVSAGFRIKKWYIEQGVKWGEADHIIIMTDYYGVKRAAAKIKCCETVTYKDVTEGLAKAFGYGDGSLATWQHRSYTVINRDCVVANVKFNGETELLVTWFDMIYPLVDI